MSLLYLDDMSRAFRKRILAAMEEYANAKDIEEIDSDHLVIIGRLKEELRDKTDQAQKLVEALEQIAKSGKNIRSTYKTSNIPFYVKIAEDAIQQWNAGKEVDGDNVKTNGPKF